MVLCGEPKVGKTALVTRHKTGEFVTKYAPTPVAEITSLRFHTSAGEVVIEIREMGDAVTADERDNFEHDCYAAADAAIVMFGLNSRSTYDGVPYWYCRIRVRRPDIPIVLCGNMVDCAERAVLPKDITFHRQVNMQYYDISAKSQYNFEKPFLYLIRRLLADDQVCFVAAPDSMQTLDSHHIRGSMNAQQLEANMAVLAGQVTGGPDLSDATQAQRLQAYLAMLSARAPEQIAAQCHRVFYFLPSPEAAELYGGIWTNPNQDSGVDLRFARDEVIPEQQTLAVKFGVRAAYCVDGEASGYWLLLRSSAGKTRQVLMLRNHVGTIDGGYRGELRAYVHNFGPGPFRVRRGESLFQLVDPQMRPAIMVRTDDADPLFADGATARGTGGFGSTGASGQAAAAAAAPAAGGSE